MQGWEPKPESTSLATAGATYSPLARLVLRPIPCPPSLSRLESRHPDAMGIPAGGRGISPGARGRDRPGGGLGWGTAWAWPRAPAGGWAEAGYSVVLAQGSTYGAPAGWAEVKPPHFGGGAVLPRALPSLSSSSVTRIKSLPILDFSVPICKLGITAESASLRVGWFQGKRRTGSGWASMDNSCSPVPESEGSAHFPVHSYLTGAIASL